MVEVHMKRLNGQVDFAKAFRRPTRGEKVTTFCQGNVRSSSPMSKLLLALHSPLAKQALRGLEHLEGVCFIMPDFTANQVTCLRSLLVSGESPLLSIVECGELQDLCQTLSINSVSIEESNKAVKSENLLSDCQPTEEESVMRQLVYNESDFDLDHYFESPTEPVADAVMLERSYQSDFSPTKLIFSGKNYLRRKEKNAVMLARTTRETLQQRESPSNDDQEDFYESPIESEDEYRTATTSQERELGMMLSCCEELAASSSRTHTRHTLKNIFIYQCTKCLSKFKSKSLAIRHIVLHTDIKRYACSLCDDLFKARSAIDSHIKKSHTGTNASILTVNEDKISIAAKKYVQKIYPDDFATKGYQRLKDIKER